MNSLRAFESRAPEVSSPSTTSHAGSTPARERVYLLVELGSGAVDVQLHDLRGILRDLAMLTVSTSQSCTFWEYAHCPTSSNIYEGASAQHDVHVQPAVEGQPSAF